MNIVERSSWNDSKVEDWGVAIRESGYYVNQQKNEVFTGYVIIITYAVFKCETWHGAKLIDVFNVLNFGAQGKYRYPSILIISVNYYRAACAWEGSGSLDPTHILNTLVR